MSVAHRVERYLEAREIPYDLLNHAHVNNSIDAARAAGISAQNIAKAVVLEDHDGHHLMAVLPANHKLKLHTLEKQLNANMHLVEEARVYQLFGDCDPGAVPALGDAYFMNSIYDEALSTKSDVYIEAGDHDTLIHLTQDQFARLMHDTRHARFSEKMFS